ncbi:VOC family protein [Desulfocurvus vexinensis]|uniref:VOC family protein n=1 Tax=Desulfocurvus vexinensis TaxID=399548 RepID=UPI0004BCCD1A|nr:VOC family protein [Desulfocurvus vexinensis]
MSRITFEGQAVFVADMAAARAFYEQALDQQVLFEVGDQYVSYAGGLALWQLASALEAVRGEAPPSPGAPLGRDNFELYFETHDLPAAWERLARAGARPLHEMREMPWGQRCLRVQDPDGHIVEVAEPLPLVIRRFLDQGLSPEQVAERTMTTLEMVQAVAAGGAQP